MKNSGTKQMVGGAIIFVIGLKFVSIHNNILLTKKGVKMVLYVGLLGKINEYIKDGIIDGIELF